MRLFSNPFDQLKDAVVSESTSSSLKSQQKQQQRPFQYRHQVPLTLGSGDRCKRVPGSCYSATDPTVASWLQAQQNSSTQSSSTASPWLFLCGVLIAALGLTTFRNCVQLRERSLAPGASVIRPAATATLTQLCAAAGIIYRTTALLIQLPLSLIRRMLAVISSAPTRVQRGAGGRDEDSKKQVSVNRDSSIQPTHENSPAFTPPESTSPQSPSSPWDMSLRRRRDSPGLKYASRGKSPSRLAPLAVPPKRRPSPMRRVSVNGDHI